MSLERFLIALTAALVVLMFLGIDWHTLTH